jgi:hypothetical protein
VCNWTISSFFMAILSERNQLERHAPHGRGG